MISRERDTLDMFSRNEDRGRFGDNESVRGNDSVRSNLIDLTVCLHHQTEKALLVSIDGDENKAEWIPKSRCEFERKSGQARGTRKNGQAVNLDIILITLPSTLAAEKGLI